MVAAPKRRNFDRSGSLCHPQSLDIGTRVADQGVQTWNGPALEWKPTLRGGKKGIRGAP